MWVYYAGKPIENAVYCLINFGRYIPFLYTPALCDCGMVVAMTCGLRSGLTPDALVLIYLISLLSLHISGNIAEKA